MYGWRATIGEIAPSFHAGAPEWERMLPDGVDLLVVTLGIQRNTPEEFERVFRLYLDAAKQLAPEANYITMGGSPILTYKGLENTMVLIKQIEAATGLKATTDLTAAIDAMKALSAKRIVMATPYEDVRNDERKRLLESCGFEVLAMKGMGCLSGAEIRRLPPYAPYRLAKEVFREAPEADAIYIPNASWGVMLQIETIEKDLGIPVVTCTQSRLWVALRTLHIRESITGCGLLLREMP